MSAASHSNSEKPGSYHPPSVYVIVCFRCACVTASELLTCITWEETLSTRVHAHVRFLLTWVSQTPLVSNNIRSAPSPSPLPVRLSHTFVILLGSIITVCIPPLEPPTTYMIFFNLLTLRFTRSAIKFCGLDKCIKSRIYHYSIVQNSFTFLKKFSTLPVRTFHQTTGNHGSFYRLYTFTFSERHLLESYMCHLFRLASLT